MRVALTGTPGTGKSSVCKELSRQKFFVVDISALAEEHGLVEHPKKSRGPGLVDVDKLRKVPLPEGPLVFLCSHFAHLLDVDTVIVLRCSPAKLKARLKERGWGEAKIRDNIEAEAIDLITVEAIGKCKRVFEVDTSSIDASEAARQIIEILNGAVEGHEPGRVDWSEEILKWY